ncbi:MAG: hypothetical protein ACHQ53_08035 [Polyangiales bacterium]
MSGTPADAGRVVTGASGHGGAGGAGDSGAAGTAGGPSDCPQITFRILPGGPGGASKFCLGGRCGNAPWVTVLDEHGNALSQDLQCGALDCATCAPKMCVGACGFSPMLDPAGAEITWEATRWTAGGTCASSGLACSTKSGCVPNGRYTAHFCADAPDPAATGVGACDSVPIPSTPTCVDVPFDYPPTAPVQGVLDPRK